MRRFSSGYSGTGRGGIDVVVQVLMELHSRAFTVSMRDPDYYKRSFRKRQYIPLTVERVLVSRLTCLPAHLSPGSSDETPLSEAEGRIMFELQQRLSSPNLSAHTEQIQGVTLTCVMVLAVKTQP